MPTSPLSTVKKLLEDNNLDAALISSLPNIIYLTQFNHFYAEEREAFILITQKNNYLFTDKRYTEAVKKHVKNFIICEISYMLGFEDWMKKLTKEENIQTLGIEENNITLSESKKIIPHVKVTKHFDLSKLRIKKSIEELVNIQKACDIGDKTFAYILSELKVGMTEKEIALLMELFVKKHNAKLSFDTIVAIEKNAAYIHHKTTNDKLRKNNLILFDFGITYNNYCSDMSRTIFYGRATDQQKKAYQAVLTAQQMAIEYIETQLHNNEIIKGSDVDKVARDFLIKQSFPSFPHALGHGIGLEVHEPPRLSLPSPSILSEGMVFSIEPGVYLTNTLGIRIEDLFVIQNGKLIQLTKAPRELFELKT